MADIIVVEDNEEIGGLLSDFLRSEGYDTYLALSGEEALEIYEAEGAKLVLLDLLLPNLDGFGVCSKIREHHNTPIIMLSAQNGKEDKLNGLLLGADDYMEKPYDIDILLAKVKGIMKRRFFSDQIVDGTLKMDKAGRRVYEAGQEIVLTHKEYELLSLFMAHPGQVFTRDQLLNRIWGYDFEGTTRTIDTHIKTLRQKLGSEGRRIVTLIRSGYKLEK